MPSRDLSWTDCAALLKVNVSERQIVLKETRLFTYGTLTATDYFESILFRGVKLEQLKKPFMAIYDSIRLPLFTTEMRTPCIGMPRKSCLHQNSAAVSAVQKEQKSIFVPNNSQSHDKTKEEGVQWDEYCHSSWAFVGIAHKAELQRGTWRRIKKCILDVYTEF